MPNILEIKNLSVSLQGSDQTIVKNISFAIPEKSIFALVGGSGSGKTTTGLSILRLLPLALKIKSGDILLQGKNLIDLSPEDMRRVRGKAIGTIFQEPLSAMNPLIKIGEQIEEPMLFFTSLNAEQREKRLKELLSLVGIREARRVANQYPHQLSGGLRQRAMIAQALSAEPTLIIADEPTSSLDVTLQARIMDLLRSLKDKFNLSILLITHDLGMVSHLADHVAVMKDGEIVESGTVKDVLSRPQHPYTQQLKEAQ